MIENHDQIPTLGRLARRTLGTCIGAIENRAELFAVEFDEENNRVLKMVIFGAGGMFMAMLAVLLGTGLIIFIVPEAARPWAALGFAIFYLVGAVGAGLAVKSLLKHTPFAESLNQIKKDAEFLDAFK